MIDDARRAPREEAAPGAEGEPGEARADALVARRGRMEAVREVARVRFAEEVQPAHVVEVRVAAPPQLLDEAGEDGAHGAQGPGSVRLAVRRPDGAHDDHGHVRMPVADVEDEAQHRALEGALVQRFQDVDADLEADTCGRGRAWADARPADGLGVACRRRARRRCAARRGGRGGTLPRSRDSEAGAPPSARRSPATSGAASWPPRRR